MLPFYNKDVTSGMPKDIADIVAFVVSDQARWVTGQNIHASGGVVM